MLYPLSYGGKHAFFRRKRFVPPPFPFAILPFILPLEKSCPRRVTTAAGDATGAFCNPR